MKRDTVCLLIHPYKNALVKKELLQRNLNQFAENLFSLMSTHQNLRANVVFPGYMMQMLDPLILSKLNDMQKRNGLEWLTCGYSEPFLSLSPLWLTAENIQHGIEIFQNYTGNTPLGFVPPFSNWEPSCIPIYRERGLHYAIISRSQLPKNAQSYCGYWITEHNGYSLIIVPTFSFHPLNAPADILPWLDRTTRCAPHTSAKQVAMSIMVPLAGPQNIRPLSWLQTFAESLDTLLVSYQLGLFSELASQTQPLGLQYLPSSFVFRHHHDKKPMNTNFLFTFETVGILHRKMIDIAENIQECHFEKDLIHQKKQLFAIQDINRYLPRETSGFHHLHDRFWTFKQMISVERELAKNEKFVGGQIRIADFLRNGTKSIIMTNNSCKVYIDHKNGGQLFGFDFRDRSVNMLAGHCLQRHALARIITGGQSKTSFIDHFLDNDCRHETFISKVAKERGDFYRGMFEYAIKKTATGVKTLLTRQGTLLNGKKPCPVTMEKVFGLEKNKAELNFVYQLGNHSLTTYSFLHAIEITIALPGACNHAAALHSNKRVYTNLLWETICLEHTQEWIFTDPSIGTSLRFFTQKPVTVWCHPVVPSGSYQGNTIVIVSPVSLPENATWQLLGKIALKKIRRKGVDKDVI